MYVLYTPTYINIYVLYTRTHMYYTHKHTCAYLYYTYMVIRHLKYEECEELVLKFLNENLSF